MNKPTMVGQQDVWTICNYWLLLLSGSEIFTDVAVCVCVGEYIKDLANKLFPYELIWKYTSLVSILDTTALLWKHSM